MESGVWVLVFGVWCFGFWVWSLGFGVWGLRLGIEGLGLGIQCSGLNVKQGCSYRNSPTVGPWGCTLPRRSWRRRGIAFARSTTDCQRESSLLTTYWSSNHRDDFSSQIHHRLPPHRCVFNCRTYVDEATRSVDKTTHTAMDKMRAGPRQGIAFARSTTEYHPEFSVDGSQGYLAHK